MIWHVLMAVAFVPTVLVLLGLGYKERLLRVAVRWRYRILSEPDRDGWQAKANFSREDQ
jgi:hypothetical protein